MNEEIVFLERELNAVQRKHEMLAIENDMLSDHLSRVREDESLGGTATSAVAASATDDKMVSGSKRRRNEGARSKQKVPQSLSLADKYRVTQQEVEALSNVIEQTRREGEQNLDILKALLEETDIRISEIKRDAYEFRRDVVVGAENPRTGKTMAERVLKYLEEKLTKKELQINKLLQKNAAYKTEIRKAEKQLRGKHERGDNLQFIDFHSLQIENQQFVVRIEETNQELLALKATSTKTVKALNGIKHRLAALSKESDFLQSEISSRKTMQAKTESGMRRVLQEKEAARREHRRLTMEVRGNPDLPDIQDYVSQKALEHDLQAQRETWRRKVELAELSAKRVRAQLRAAGLE